jgi:hypothetical protein
METYERRGYSKLMIDIPSLKLTLDILGLSRPQIREMTGHCTLRKQRHTMSIFKNDLLCKLLNEVVEATSHIIVNCKAFTRRRYTTLEYFDLEESLPKKNLTILLLYLATESKLFALELMQLGECSKPLGFSVRDYKYRLLLRFSDHDHHHHN